ncbi:hypothetical protein FS317_01030 [Microvirga sp. M8]|nr:hypothetical protein [Microvirga tunisiensis]
MAFDLNGLVYGQVGLKSICRKREARVIVGPFAHLSAFVDTLWGVRRRHLGEESDESVVFHRVDDATLVRAPAEVPFFRTAKDPMHPFLAAELLWRAQTALDSDEDVDSRLAIVEQGYGGPRIDPKTREEYEEEADFDLPADALVPGPKAQVKGEAIRVQVVPVSPAKAEACVSSLPVPAVSGLRASRTVNSLSAAPVSPAPAEKSPPEKDSAPGRRTSVSIDWSNLPVCVVEQKITAGFSYLKAKPRIG